MKTPTTTTCRICSGDARSVFIKTFLYKYHVHIYQCSVCGSLQTEDPYWLGEAYSNELPGEDLGAVARSQRVALTVFYLARALHIPQKSKLLDFGGGNGLLVRMLRDLGMDAYWSDKYAKNQFAIGFEYQSDEKYQMITSIEVFEHMPYPMKDFQAIFHHDPQMVYGTTCCYENQGDNWSYFYPNSGGHVSFYTVNGLCRLGEQFGYKVLVNSPHVLFYRNRLTRTQRLFIKRFIFGRGRKLLNIIWPLLTKRSLQSDDNKIMKHIGLSRN